jgi:hypothetical protein
LHLHALRFAENHKGMSNQPPNCSKTAAKADRLVIALDQPKTVLSRPATHGQGQVICCS